MKVQCEGAVSVFRYAAVEESLEGGWVSELHHDRRWKDSQARNLILLKVPSVLLVNQNKIEIVSCAELLVDVSECRSQLKASQKESNGNRLACKHREGRSAVFVFNSACCYKTHLALAHHP
jgi:hypothetical protein